MENLTSLLVKENKSKLADFKKGLSELKDTHEIQNLHFYKRFLTPAIINKNLSLKEMKDVLLSKYSKEIEKQLTEKTNKLRAVKIAPELVSVKIVVEWSTSKMWGANPTAEAWFLYKGENGSETEYIKTRSITGCGYDKLSTAVAEALNESNALLKTLYTEKNKAKNKNISNREIFGYGSGYGILPIIEDGVGVSCYNSIFNKVGFEFKSIAGGKNFDVFMIEKIKK